MLATVVTGVAGVGSETQQNGQGSTLDSVCKRASVRAMRWDIGHIRYVPSWYVKYNLWAL